MIRVESWTEEHGWTTVWYVRDPVVVGLDFDGACMFNMATDTRRYLAIHPEKNVYTVIDIGFDGLLHNGERVPPGYGRSIQLFDEIEFSGRRIRVGWISMEEYRQLMSAPTWPPPPERVAAPAPKRRTKAPKKAPKKAQKKAPKEAPKEAGTPPKKRRSRKRAPEEG